jgi:segregation and condensation protein B
VYNLGKKGRIVSSLTSDKIQSIIEAALMIAGHPLNVGSLQQLFNEEERPSSTEIKSALLAIQDRHSQQGGIELQEVASGYRFQTKSELNPWLIKLWEERTPRYSRAFLETLAIIAYKQPITRAEIEEIRGVSVSSQIIKTLLEREWVKILGHREIPGRPAILGTTKTFLDYFNLSSLTELPILAEFAAFETQEKHLQIELSIDETPETEENIEENKIEEITTDPELQTV